MEPDEIQALSTRAAAGDRDALEALLTAYLPSLRAFVRVRMGKLIRGRESSSDLVQSVCREILEQASMFQHASEGAFKRWLFRMAIRKLSRRKDFLLADKRDVLREQAIPDGSAAELLSGYASLNSPSRGAAAREEVERIEAALDSLPEDYRQVILLSRVAGLSRKEIAEETGRTEGSVRMLLFRALAELAMALAQSEDAADQ